MDKIERGNPLTQSADIVKENLETLKRLFPTIVKEGKIDVDELKALIDDEVETSEEYYRFTWAGKSEARREANKPSTGTLRPNKADSKDWDTTGNIFIEGDNLEVLKLMQKSYAGKIKMMYFDPPYNTGNDFVYKDNYADNLGNYLTMSKQLDGEGNKLSTNTESDGRYHSNWLNMMYPRLKLSRNLMTDDGVIFISIGSSELSNLKMICNEIFGEENFIDVIPRVVKSTSFKGTFFSPSIDYILCYAKNISFVNAFTEGVIEKQFPKIETKGERKGEYYRDDTAYYLSSLDITRGSYSQRYWVECPDGSKAIPPGVTFPPTKGVAGDGVWRWGPETYEKQKHLLVFKESTRSPLLNENGQQSKYNIYTKSYLTDRQEKGKLPRNYFVDGIQNRKGTQLLNELDIPFSFPKPVELPIWFMEIVKVDNDDIVLDIFAGSGTTAHSVMQINSEDGKNRKFICIQLPELINEENEAYKMGYKTIAEVCKDRIRKIGDKIQSEIKTDLFAQNEQKLDLGFKAFKLDSSNIHSWDGSVENFEANLFNAEYNIKKGRTNEDVLFEILLKYGLDLTVPIQEKAVGKCKVYSIGAGVLFICLSDNITTEVAKAIGEWKKELEPATCRVLFKDNGFIDDVAKTNSVQILRQYGIEECNSI